MEFLKFKRLDERAVLPIRANPTDAGLDLLCLNSFKIYRDCTATVNTGLAVEIPPGYAGFIQPRSGLAAKKGITVLNSPGLIDSDYRGELKVLLYNTSRVSNVFDAYEKIAQLVIVPIALPFALEVDELSDTVRGSGGFGSTDKRQED